VSHKLAVRCIDVNSPFCPCILAETNQCITCSHLKGQQVCDCNWSGTCILYEKQWQSKSKGWRSDSIPARIDIETEFSRKEEVAENTYLLEFTVPLELAQELNRTGSFVFLRRVEDPQYFHFPVGVMKVINNNIQVVVEAVGTKSQRILETQVKEILVRGPYYNGVLGQPWIDNITCGTILLVAGGMGQPPALPIAAKLRANNNHVIAVIAPGKIGTIFIDQELREMGVVVHNVDSMRRSGLGILGNRFADRENLPDLIVSAGPDSQHYGIIAAMHAAGVDLPMAATNNATMCCGEGVCGSCEHETLDSRLIRLCKVQTDFKQLLT
jgi:dihydroorotate dehydrogenase electron transfer subunit